MAEDGVRSAFCPVFYAANGGQIGTVRRSSGDYPARGLCDRPFDCNSCGVLRRYLDTQVSQGYSYSWLCNSCIDGLTPKEEYALAGFYGAGRNPTGPNEGFEELAELSRLRLFPNPGTFDNSDDDSPSLHGCETCGWQSTFLQLVIRQAR